MDLLIVILIVLLVARILGELMERIGQPGILGEIIAGVVLGIIILQFPGSLPWFSNIQGDRAFQILWQLGIFFLMFMAGMEMEVKELARASKKGIAIALGGVVIPFALGFGLGQIFLPGSEYKFLQSFFLGTALSITAIAVSVRVLMDLKQIQTRVGHTIISAAVIDDIIGLVLLSLLLGALKTGGIPQGGELVFLIIKVLGFFFLAIIFGKFLLPFITARFTRLKSKEFEFSMAIVIALLFGALAEYIGLHFIMGAFVVGLMIKENVFKTEVVEDIKERVSGITLGFLAPIFFISIGLHLDLAAFSSFGGIVFTIALIGAAILGKLVGCGGVAKLLKFSFRESLIIGVGMNGRGAVEIIIAVIALEAGLFALPLSPVVSSIFSGIVIMAIITTFITPIGLKLLLKVRP